MGAIITVVVALGYLVVIMTRISCSRSEWVVSLVSTVIGSIEAGGFIIQHFSMHDYATTWAGMCAIGVFSLQLVCRFGPSSDGHLTMLMPVRAQPF